MKKIIQKSRFILLLVAMMTLSLTNAFAAGYTELCKIHSDKVATSSTYGAYTKTVDQRGWVITFGGNTKSVGTNSGNRSKCVLGDTYAKYAITNLVSKTDIASAFVSTTSIADVSKISYTFNGGSNQTNTKVYLIYSSDNTTFDTIPLVSGTQGVTIKSGTAYEFAKCSGYFGLLFKATNSSGNWRIDNVEITFYKETSSPQITLSPKTITFGEVYKDATVAAKTVKATLSNLTDDAIVSLKDGSAFSVSPASLSKDGDITITPITTTIGEYNDTLFVSATGAADTAVITMNVVEAPAPTGVFTKYTGAALVEGDYVVCVGTDAMKNTVTSSRLDYAGITASNNQIENPDAAVIWHIAPAATDGYWTMYNASAAKYAASTGAANKAQLLASGTDNMSLWSVSSPSDGNYNFLNKKNSDNSVNAKLQKNGTYGFACYASYSNITLYAKLGSYAVTKATGIQYGNIDAKANDTTVMGKSLMAGTTVTLSNTPGDGYKLKAYKVFKTGDETATITVTDSTFIMPAYAVTISAEFEAAKELLSVAITTPADTTEFWKGQAFNATGLVLTATFSTGQEVVTPTSFSGYDMNVVGPQTVTVSFAEGVTTKTDTYDITIKAISNTQATAYTVAEILSIVDSKSTALTTDSVYVKGIVISATAIGTYGNSTIDVKDPETDGTKFIEFFRCLDLGNTNFTEDYVGIGDTVTAKGIALLYVPKSGSPKYELNQGCYLVDYKKYSEPKKDISNTPETAYTPAKAIELYNDASSDLTKYVYVKGVVKNNPSLSTSGEYSGSYYQVEVTAAETTEPVFTYFRMYNTGGVAFEEDIVGMYDTVMAYGTLYKHNSTYELTNCSMYERKAFVPRATSVSVSPASATIAANASVQLSATVLPEDAVDKSVTWSVIEGGTYVEVSAAGLVSGKNAGAGSAKVMVTTVDGGFKDTCVITVTAAETFSTIEKTSFTAVNGGMGEVAQYRTYKGGAGTAPALNGSIIRLYQKGSGKSFGGYITIAALPGMKIGKIEITSAMATSIDYTVDDETTHSSAISMTKDVATTISDLDNDSVSIYCLGSTSSTRLYVSAIKVYYTGSLEDFDLAVSDAAKTVYEIGETVDHAGAVVTATFVNAGDRDVTFNSTFTDPDMSTAGQKQVAANFASKSATYNITVNEPAPATLDTLALSGTYQTIFQQGETFNHTGVEVTAIYSDESEKDVTNDATFSTPDMTTAGQKVVTVSYTDSEVTKTTTYNIMVKSSTMDKENVLLTDYYSTYTYVEMKTIEAASMTITYSKGTNTQNVPTFYNSDKTGRVYKDNTMKIEATRPIYMISFTTSKFDAAFTIADAKSIKESAQYGVVIFNNPVSTVTLTAAGTVNMKNFTVYYTDQYEAVRTGLSVDQIGTICQGKSILDVRGAVLYSVEYGNTQQITFKEMQLPIAAGTPAVFQAEAADFEVIYGSKTTTDPVEDEEDGLVGLVQGSKVAIKEGNVLINGGRLRLVGENCWLTADHAYINMKEVSPTAPETPAPGRRLVLTNAEAQVVTGLNAAAIKDVEMQKVIMNGQMLIIREGKMYNAQGQMMK